MNQRINALRWARIKEIIHPILIKTMSLKTTGVIDVAGKMSCKENYLIVANHACIEDIPTLGQAVQEHFYLLVSDEDQKTIDGIGLELNGVEWVHRTDVESRKQVYQNITEILKRGKNFAMYPEATWNLSPNQLMMPMSYGCIKIALESQKGIVPIVTYFTKQKRYIKIGNPYFSKHNLLESIHELRDIMATMIYELMEKYYAEAYQTNPVVFCKKIDNKKYFYEKRDSLKEGMWDQNIINRYSAYERARKDMAGVREFESQFIFTSKDEANQFFQEFNSIVYYNEKNERVINRISSENNGYDGLTFGEESEKDSFGFGYNEKVLKKTLK